MVSRQQFSICLLQMLNQPMTSCVMWLQVFTAAVFSFAHGSNDVANSIGPFATVYGIYRDGGVSKNASVPIWILVVGTSCDAVASCIS